MGGFEGGDEAGFWEEEQSNSLYGTSQVTSKIKYQIIQDDTIYKIKTYGFNGIIQLSPFKSNELIIEGNTTDIIQKAYKALVDFTDDMEIVELFQTHKIIIEVPDNETILGALFILLTKDICNLILNKNELKEIALKIGANITPFI
jgi:hypothetical protein